MISKRTFVVLAAPLLSVVVPAHIVSKGPPVRSNVALAANPIGLVIIALAALVAGLVYAWQNSEEFREVVTKAWEDIKVVVQFAEA